jgi:hypothetical protein
MSTLFMRTQLESSMFALVVIQIKPQMELLLNLPPSALTKQIRLTQASVCVCMLM